MKLSSDTNHPDFHPVVNFIDSITCDNVKVERCVHIDTELGELQVISMPTKVKNGEVQTHVVRGKVAIVWREPLKSPNGIVGTGSQRVRNQFITEWHEREALRVQENHAI